MQVTLGNGWTGSRVLNLPLTEFGDQSYVEEDSTENELHHDWPLMPGVELNHQHCEMAQMSLRYSNAKIVNDECDQKRGVAHSTRTTQS